MASVPAVPEFRDADQCRQHGLEIIRPKPRRLGDLNRPHDTRMPAEGASLRASHRDLVGGSAPSLTKLSVRDLWPSPSGRSSHEASPRPCLSAAASSSSPGPPGSSRATPVRETPVPSSGGGSSSGASSRASPGSLALSAATRASPARNKLSLAEPVMTREQEEQQQADEGFPTDPNFSVYRDSASNTDCGSLSKSSSDGDPVVSRRKPLARLKSRRRNILSFPLNPEDPRLGVRRHDLYAGGSSSDENRSSGHASMSDGGQSSYASSTSPPTYLDFARAASSGAPLTKSLHNVPGHLKAVPEDERVPPTSISASRLCRRSQPSSSSSSHGRRGYRSSSGASYELHENSANLDDIRQAVEQLAARTQQGTSNSGCGGYSTSTYSSDAEPVGGGVRRLMRHSSLETIATNITSAEEFVWVDNLQSRLVEMQRPPWTNHDVLRVLQSGRLRDQRRKISMEVVPRLSFLLQRPLVRVAREAQRLSRPLGVCGKRQVSGALCIVLSPALAESCVSACHRAAAMYTSSSCDQLRLGKSARAGLQLPVGRFQRWACDARLAPCVHEYGALYLTAAAENLLEELVLRCLEPGATLTAAALEAAIASSGELWGLFQPFAHLNAGRTATGALSMPRWPQQLQQCGSVRGGQGVDAQQPQQSGQQPSSKDDHHRSPSAASDAHEQSFLTTCVGSIAELSELLSAVTQLYRSRTGSQRPPLSWGPGAVHALYHYMRCSQLEHAEHGSSRRSAGPELIYERPYQVLPPLVEWVRVAHAHAEYRRSPLVDQDDVMQAARLLLPGVDCPVRAIGELHEERLLLLRRSGSASADDVPQEWARQLQTELAFRLLSLCGQQGTGAAVVSQALALLPTPTRLDTRDQRGLTPLMLACARGDEAAARVLVQAGADIHAEAPLCTPQCPLAIPEVQGWTALTFATTQGMASTVRMLLEKGANVEGSSTPNEEKVTETPLQLAVAFSHLELISVLLSYGAKPFCATPFLDAQSYGGAHPRGCYGAAAVAAAHGRRSALRRLLAHRALPEADDQGDVLSLHEILAEGAGTTDRRTTRSSKTSSPDEGLESGGQQVQQRKAGQPLSKAHVKALQEAMYQSAENGYLEVTLDLRSIGVPWTLHCWMQTLTMAHEQQLESTIDELLQDFLHVWPEDCSTQFVEDCLPLLFSIFRHSKNEGTTLLLADIFSVCYGEESIKEIRDVSLSGGARIDPKYVNNPEMSDVQFRVEGRAFYAHKIILVNASPRFKAMLSSKAAEGSTPVVQINDIRYDIFQLVMQYLYKGGCEDFDIDQNDVLELLTAATFFQLDGLIRFCEARCSNCVDLDNVVATYVHAKVYNAVQLLEYCQGFLLQNLVALLSYDEGVRKLLFGKRLHNHDVLSGLLLTLQARVKQRVAMSKSLAAKRASTGHDAKMRLVGPNK